jgi:hypothetical protein
MTEAPDIDWARTPYLTTVVVLAVIFSAVGVLTIAVGITASLLTATAALISGSVLLGTGVMGWLLYAGALFWRHESRNQMLTICAAIVRDEQPGV